MTSLGFKMHQFAGKFASIRFATVINSVKDCIMGTSVLSQKKVGISTVLIY